MRPNRMILLSVLVMFIVLITGAVNAQEATPDPEITPEANPPAAQPTPQTYVVQSGDTLFRIATRFGTTTTAIAEANNIVNTSQISVGQTLIIPTTSGNTPSQPANQDDVVNTPVPPGGTTTYIVQSGDTLFRIAINNNTTVAELQALNNLTGNAIFAGQELLIPAAGGTVQQPPVEQPTSTESAPVVQQPADVIDTTFEGDAGFAYGIEAFMIGQEITNLTNQLLQLGVSWVKVRVEWRDLEAVEGEITFVELDTIIEALNQNGFNIMLTVTHAPDWAREQVDPSQPLAENAPPADLADFDTFMSALASRYVGQVDAYQIWDEPNIRRNWSCQVNLGSEESPQINITMCETEYVDLLQVAHNAISGADANALVITAGLAPTGFNDGINAISDRAYIQRMYDTGVTEYADAIGVHPGGWANPPDALCCEQPAGVNTHYENESFYFLETIRAYRNLMVQNGDGNRPIWVTRFGWGSSEDTEDPAEINIFVTYTSLSEQAIYLPRAYAIGRDLGFIGPMFLDNLNGCEGLTYRAEACYTSLTGPDGLPRPAFTAVQMIDKSGAEMDMGSPLPDDQ